MRYNRTPPGLRNPPRAPPKKTKTRVRFGGQARACGKPAESLIRR